MRLRRSARFPSVSNPAGDSNLRGVRAHRARRARRTHTMATPLPRPTPRSPRTEHGLSGGESQLRRTHVLDDGLPRRSRERTPMAMPPRTRLKQVRARRHRALPPQRPLAAPHRQTRLRRRHRRQLVLRLRCPLLQGLHSREDRQLSTQVGANHPAQQRIWTDVDGRGKCPKLQKPAGQNLAYVASGRRGRVGRHPLRLVSTK